MENCRKRQFLTENLVATGLQLVCASAQRVVLDNRTPAHGAACLSLFLDFLGTSSPIFSRVLQIWSRYEQILKLTLAFSTKSLQNWV